MNFVFQKEKGEIDAWLANMDEAAMEQGIGEAAKALKVSSVTLLTKVAAFPAFKTPTDGLVSAYFYF
jgi:hypothetical protein